MWKITASVFVGMLLLVPTANAQFAFMRQEVIAFESAMMPVDDFLTGKKGTPVTLAGYLRLPKSSEKNSVVVLFHGVGGLGGEGSPAHDWSRVLNRVLGRSQSTVSRVVVSRPLRMGQKSIR